MRHPDVLLRYFLSTDSTNNRGFVLAAFTDFVNAARVTEGAGGASGHDCTRASVDMIFMSCCAAGPAGPLNPKRSLVRWQFFEAVVRMAFAKYGAATASSSSSDDEQEIGGKSESGSDCNTAAALRRMASDIEACERDDDLHWYERLWVEECDSVFREHEASLRMLFKKYTDMDRHEVKGATGMQLQTWSKLLDHIGALDNNFNERELRLCFVYAAQTRSDEFTKTKHLQRDFIEFIDAVGRFSDTKDFRPLECGVLHGPGEGKLYLKLAVAIKMLLTPLKRGFAPASRKQAGAGAGTDAASRKNSGVVTGTSTAGS